MTRQSVWVPSDFVGNLLCLDFANLPAARAVEAAAAGNGTAYGHFLDWARHAGAVGQADEARLAALAARHPDAAETRFAEAVEVSRIVARVVHAVVHDERPAPTDLDAVNKAVANAMTHLELRPEDGRMVQDWRRTDTAEDLGQPIWAALRSACEAMTIVDRRRLRECGSKSCRWLFYDESKGGRRRWCSMDTCGNVAKARRHRARQHHQHEERAVR